MLRQGLTLTLLIWSAGLFQESHCFCDKVPWAKVGWEILPEDMEKLKLTLPPSTYCLPFPLEKMCCTFPTIKPFYSCMFALCTLLKSLCFILASLTTYSLWTKWKQHLKFLREWLHPWELQRREKKKKTEKPAVSQMHSESGNSTYSSNLKKLRVDPSTEFLNKKLPGGALQRTDQILSRLVNAISILTSYLDQPNDRHHHHHHHYHHHHQKSKFGQVKEKKKDAENDWPFPTITVCSHAPPSILNTSHRDVNY
ncbi:testis-expressed protein 50 isoform X1 [Ornithorhynchus anatinus]|uniref:Testis expressed 50 n=1 Tax=Ornithorhynchus anatinus TaxID=9258 RepID=K7EIA8_ORNAN|nr:testis-expressed protein 50 isoform X1 [Ornithorhynchus anatinus]